MAEYCEGCKERQDRIDEFEGRFSDSLNSLVGQSLISEAWDLISELLVGMKTADSRWEKASEWLNENRGYQIAKPRLPNN